VTASRVRFVVGMSRCGITPLCRALNQHPELAVFGESRFFGRCWVDPASPRGYERAQLDAILRVLVQFRWRATVGEGPGSLTLSLHGFRALLREVFAEVEPPISPAALFTAIAARVADTEGKRYALEKTPHHLNWVDRIVEHLPDSRFVVLLCDPYAFARFHRRDDPLYHPITCAILWRRYMRSFEHVERRHPDRIVVVEANALASGRGLDRVQRFLGVEEHDLPAPPGLAVVFTRTGDEAEAAETFWVNAICGRLLRRHGYTRRPTPFGVRPILGPLVSLPRWSRRSLPRARGPNFGSTRYLLNWLRP
jgi:hypothetical protein